LSLDPEFWSNVTLLLRVNLLLPTGAH
jgi:hypothetical protein